MAGFHAVFFVLPLLSLGEVVTGGTLKLTWSDCGDSSTHAKVTGLTPDTLTLGQSTTISGSGTLDEAVTDGTFSIDIKAGGGIVHQTFTGDICQAKKFTLPLGVGSVQWDGMACPLAAGSTNVKMDIQLSGAIPASLAKAAIQATAKTSTGDKLLCMAVNTAPAVKVEEPLGGTLKLTWSDCGDSSTHAKVTGLTPDTLTLGQSTTISGSGTLDEAVTDGTFSIDVKAGGGIVHQTFTGDICQAKKFTLPLGVGSVQWDGMACPLAAGSTSVKMDIQLSGAIPASLAKAAIQATAKTSTGDKLLCMAVNTAPALSMILV